MRNCVCLLPAWSFPVIYREPHPCGGYYTREVWCWGPGGRIGYWMRDEPTHSLPLGSS